MGSHDTACINTRVDDREREGTEERERLGMRSTAHSEDQPSSMTNLCDVPTQCADMPVDSSDVAMHTTNLGHMLLHACTRMIIYGCCSLVPSPMGTRLWLL